VCRQKPELYDKLKDGQEPKVYTLLVIFLQKISIWFYLRMYAICSEVKFLFALLLDDMCKWLSGLFLAWFLA